jgi:hypothetical protein
MTTPKLPRIYTCPEWGARRPKQGITTVGAAAGIVFHHTAGHHREISLPADESQAEAFRYARDIQAMHMAPGGLGTPNGGIDSGHNFLVCRNGMILQGRWLTVAAIEAGHMVASAHAGSAKYNRWVGIEHEHNGREQMTKAQAESSALVQAWIALHYGRSSPLPVDPHSAHYATSCPANLKAAIGPIRERAGVILRQWRAVL